jgi:hypothetical protein
MMDRADVTLGFLLAYIVAAALHAGLAASIQRRGYRAVEVRVFATANWMLAAWHLLQGVEYTQALGLVALDPRWLRVLLGSELLVGALVLALFFQLFATFERIYRRQAPSLRAAITTHVHRHRRAYIPMAYAAIAVGMVLYAADATGTTGFLATVRTHVGPTSAYLFGGTLLFMVFVLFPARPGQERIPVPAIGRALLLISLGVTIGLIALWHDDHPRRVTEALIPWLNLQSVAFCIFLAFLRYEFSFLDGYIDGVLRFLTWSVVVLAAYFAFNRMVFPEHIYGRYLTSLSRIAVLLLAVGLAPGLGNVVARASERLFFGRDGSGTEGLKAFARRLGKASTLSKLVEGSGRDLAREFHAHAVHIVVGENLPADLSESLGSTPIRLKLPLVHESQTVGWLLMGERRNLYPYFDSERRHLRVVAELLAAAIVHLRGMGRTGAVGPRSAEEDLSEEVAPSTGAEASFEPAVEQTSPIDRAWMAEVLEVGHDASDRSPDVAVEVLRRLHRMQKHLEEGGPQRVALADELVFAQDYLALEKLRLRNRLEVVVGVDPRVGTPLVPRGILYPLLENAFRHGVGRELRVGRVEVHVQLEGGELAVEVLDNGGGFPVGFDPEELPRGGGLLRLQRTLQRRVPDQWRLWVDTAARDGGAVRLYLSQS